MKIKIGKNIISNKSKTYFIADIAANHDGNISRAKKLIRLAAVNGADAAKFQHFKAETIVSDFGFKKFKKKAHQKDWKKSVFEVYQSASINFQWTKILKKECDKYKIDFLTSPYDLEYVDKVEKYIKAYKIGSGDITWHEIINKISKKKKPVIIATGASNMAEVEKALKIILKNNKKIILMQCNTNYEASENNFNYINLNVLNSFKKKFGKKVILGLSDHTHGHTTVLGAVMLGARAVEKHFTDDNSREGPDHKFSLNPTTWREMVIETRKLEKSMGNGIKIIEKNELESSVVQRRSLRTNKNLSKGTIIKKLDLVALRPCPKDAIAPSEIKNVIGKKAKFRIKKGDHLSWKKIH